MGGRGMAGVLAAAALAALCGAAAAILGPGSLLPGEGGSDIQLIVEELARCSNGRAVLVLREKDGDRLLAVPVSPDEARALDPRLRGERPTRGNAKAQELAGGAIRALGGRVVRASIDDVTQERASEVSAASSQGFGSHVTVARGKGRLQVEAAPADAVALALEQGAAIFAARRVLDRAGLTREEAAALRESHKARAAGREPARAPVIDL